MSTCSCEACILPFKDIKETNALNVKYAGSHYVMQIEAKKGVKTTESTERKGGLRGSA